MHNNSIARRSIMGGSHSEAAPAPQEHAWGYLTLPEVRFLDAAVERLIPTDELGPGAKDAGVTVFIDRQLCSPYGVMARAYRMGPWPEGTPQQGWQCPLTPQEVYRQAIREIDAMCTKQYGKPFSLLGAEQQDTLLQGLEKGRIELQALSSKVFFDLLLKNTMEGFFSDPVHGGNRDKAGWKLLGFPGVGGASYNKHLEEHGKPYRVHPVSILDIRQGKAKLDAQGLVMHQPLEAEPD
jgi:gluconate 2-dehydrogenase gamma chain